MDELIFPFLPHHFFCSSPLPLFNKSAHQPVFGHFRSIQTNSVSHVIDFCVPVLLDAVTPALRWFLQGPLQSTSMHSRGCSFINNHSLVSCCLTLQVFEEFRRKKTMSPLENHAHVDVI